MQEAGSYPLYAVQGYRFCVKGSARLLDTLVGCRQGALESPPIFNIYLDTVVRCARKEVLERFPECGARIEFAIPSECSNRQMRQRAPAHGETQVLELLYADDEVVFAKTPEQLRQILIIYDQTFRRFGLTMAYSKTETMGFNVGEAERTAASLFKVNDAVIKNVT